MVAGDLACLSALYACHVEDRCEGRVVLVPGLLALPWYREQQARRHPDLKLPARVRDVHELVDAQIDARPVLLLPSITARDPGLSAFDATPSLLLFRLSRTAEADRAARRAEALAWGRAMAAGDEARCEGCAISLVAPVHPSLGAGLADEYGIAMENHGLVARDAGDAALAQRLRDRARALRAAAR